MSNIKQSIMGPVGTLVGLAIGLAIVAVVAGLSVMSGSVSTGLTEAISMIATFLGIIGLGIAVGILIKVLS